MTHPPLFRHARSTALAIALLGAALAQAQAQAANPSMLNDFKFDAPIYIHKLPFAKYNLVLQVSEDDPARWELTLNNALNVLNSVGQENARVIVVAYGPGLKMLFKDSKVAKRIASLNTEGIEFDACHNTMEGMAKKLGHLPVLVPQAVIVPAGVLRIMQLEHAGFEYIKP